MCRFDAAATPSPLCDWQVIQILLSQNNPNNDRTEAVCSNHKPPHFFQQWRFITSQTAVPFHLLFPPYLLRYSPIFLTILSIGLDWPTTPYRTTEILLSFETIMDWPSSDQVQAAHSFWGISLECSLEQYRPPNTRKAPLSHTTHMVSDGGSFCVLSCRARM